MRRNKEKFFSPKYSSLIFRIFKSRLFLKNFIIIALIMTIFLGCFSSYVLSTAKNSIVDSCISSSEYQLEKAADYVDNYLKNIRYIAASLDIDPMVRIFFTNDQPEQLYSDYYAKVQSILQTYTNGFSALHSIYLYSEHTDSILASNGHSSTAAFSDKNWLDDIDLSATGNSFFFRAVNDHYPFVLTMVKQTKIDNYPAVILINVNVNDLLSYGSNTREKQNLYVVSDDSLILARRKQRNLFEPLSTVENLSHFQEECSGYSLFCMDTEIPYVYAQTHSDTYPWSYATFSSVPEYSVQLSHYHTLFTTIISILLFVIYFICFLLAAHYVQPIYDLLKLLENPQQSFSSNVYNETEIAQIAEHIISSAQTNQQLIDELSNKLNLLNQTRLIALQSQINPHFLFNTLNMIHIQASESLGYDHPLPDLTLKVSELLRYAIESTDLVSLETELYYTKIYCNILRERHCGKPNIDYQLDPTAYEAKVPKLFIQPLIENAIFHGFVNMTEESTITLSCFLEHGFCYVSVEDNGVGMSQQKIDELKETLTPSATFKNNIGIKNVVTRMHLLYGDDFSIEISSTLRKGSKFQLNFPNRT